MENRGAWTGTLYTGDKNEQLVEAMGSIALSPPMSISLFFATSGEPDFNSFVAVISLHVGGNAEDGKIAFKPFYDIGPAQEQTGNMPNTEMNKSKDLLCNRGDRKQAYGIGLRCLDPAMWRAVYEEYVKHVKNSEFANSAIFVERYSYDKASSVPDSSSSYAFRLTLEYNTLIVNWYADVSLDMIAQTFGTKVRGMLQASAGLDKKET